MADVVFHPTARKKLEARRAELAHVIASIPMQNFNLFPAEYREFTRENAASCGLSVMEMHQRGVDNLLRISREELATIDEMLTKL